MGRGCKVGYESENLPDDVYCVVLFSRMEQRHLCQPAQVNESGCHAFPTEDFFLNHKAVAFNTRVAVFFIGFFWNLRETDPERSCSNEKISLLDVLFPNSGPA